MDRALLVISDGHGRPLTHVLPDGSVVVGRGSAADIVIGSDRVSSRHARLHWDGSHLRLIDLGSTSGTQVNGSPVVDWVDLRDGDTVKFGMVDGRVILPESSLDASRADGLPGPAANPTPAPWRKAFITHAVDDQPVVDSLSAYLRSEGWDVYSDQVRLQPGEDWGGRVADTIARCRVVVAIVSPSALRSHRVDGELALARSADRPILAVQVDDTDPRAVDRQLGLYLDRHRVVDFSPLHGDLGLGEMEEIAWTMDRHARGAKSGPASGMHRVGSVLMFGGVAALLVAMSWFVLGFTTALARMAEFFAVLAAGEVTSEDDFAAVQRAWGKSLDALLDNYVLGPVLLLALVSIVVGYAFRRRSRRAF